MGQITLIIIAVLTTLLPLMVRSVVPSCPVVLHLFPRTPGSGGEDLAGVETNLTIGTAPQSRREDPPPTTAAAVATAAPYSCRAGCRP